MSQGRPSKWTGMIAQVRVVIARSICSGSMLYVSASTSTSTGTRPTWAIGHTVVAQVTAGVITSAPGCSGRSLRGLVRAATASRFALEPEFTITAWRTPR